MVSNPSTTVPPSSPIHTVTWRGAGDSGRGRSGTAERVGRTSPRHTSATSTSTTGTACCNPVTATQSGSHCVAGSTAHPKISDCNIPMPRPAAVATANERSPPSRAAASAGTTSNGVVVEFNPAMGSISTMAAPASTAARAQLAMPRRSGDNPMSRAPFSLSALARVARPNLV